MDSWIAEVSMHPPATGRCGDTRKA
eukprot:COSAG03_NODE_17806_length_367_cov_1.716418_1_plen_24_part_01